MYRRAHHSTSRRLKRSITGATWRKAEHCSGDARQATPEVIQRQAGINDGKGFVFISHTGEIYPSGFLPISAGNIRRDSLLDVYRYSPHFRTLRNADNMHGKCGDCEFRNLCGGSRSRSFALTGDYLAEDPRCVYRPKTTGARKRVAPEVVAIPRAGGPCEPLIQVQPETFR